MVSVPGVVVSLIRRTEPWHLPGLPLSGRFPGRVLDHLEVDRRNGVATRNARLAAIHAFARYAAANHSQHMELCQRLLAVRFKRARQRLVEYLEADELQALLDALDPRTPGGRRDRALLLTLFNTGARAQEILDLRPCDLQVVQPFQARLRSKGRKERLCPPWPQTVETLRALLAERGIDPADPQPLFRNYCGEPLTRFGVGYLLRKYAHRACSTATTLAAKCFHPHVLRHTTAMHLLQGGVDIVTISH